MGQSLGALEKERSLTKVWSSPSREHFIQIGQCGQTVQVIMYATRVRLCSVCILSSVEKGLIFESYLSHMGKDGSWEVAVSRTQQVGNFLTVAVFQEHGPQESIHTVNEHQAPARASNRNLWSEDLQPLAVSPSSSW